MRFFFAIADLFRFRRRALAVGLAVAVCVAGVAFVAARALAPGTPTEPLPLALAVCAGSGTTLDPDAPGEATWTGSHSPDDAVLRCAWSGATAGGVAEHLEALGFSSVEVSEDVVDHLGRADAWVVNAEPHGAHPGVSVGGVASSATVDVIVGGFIHVHSDGTQHRHDSTGDEIGD